ncbi:MAG: tetratricopeptide repeat protein, partial [Streptosporangiaceae bacterium]
ADLDVQQEMRDVPDPAGRPLIVGAIPGEPPGFRLRAEALAKLDSVGAEPPVMHVVIGMPGAGKTQLAAGYARARLPAGWRLVAWVNAADIRTLLAGLGAVADAMGLSAGGAGQDAGDLGPVVRRWLETEGDGCLLIFDDAKDCDLLRPFVPADGAAHVLVTSERQSVADLGASVPVDVFTAEEARAFLAERTALADDAEAAKVVSELGYLPLALAQAAAVIAGQQLSYGTYLERLRALPTGEHLAPEPGQRYPPGVAAAVLLSLDAARASDQSGVSAQVMEIIAVLSGAGVRRALLHAAGQAGVLASDGQCVAPVLVDGALEHLARWSLLAFSLDGQTVIMHDLVTRVVRDWLACRKRLTAAGWAAALVLEAQSRLLPGFQDRPAIRDISVQVMALAENMGRSADEELMRVLLRLRFFVLSHLTELGDSASQAVAIGEPLTADVERLLGPDHSDTLLAWDGLAAAYRAVGRNAEAIPLLERTLTSRQRTLGPDHPATVTSQSNLAAAYRDAGRVSEAIPLLELILAGRERRLAAEHPQTLAARNNLAAAYQAAGRAAQAIPLLEQNLAGCERVLGTDHLRTLAARNNLANAYRDVSRAPEAIPLLQQNLAGCERVLGTDHFRTLAARNNLAAAYQAAGRAAEAIPLFEQNLAGCERVLGPGHPRTLAARINLAAANYAAGRAG